MRPVQAYLFSLLPKKIQRHIYIVGECWVWTGVHNRNGYARVYYQGKRPMAHRLVWELVGRKLEDGKVLDHLCRCRNCVNPTHLSQVTVQHNTHRGDAKLFKKLCRGQNGYS